MIVRVFSRNDLLNLRVGGDWNMNLIFPYIGNVIIPTDELIFFRGVGIPPTRFLHYFINDKK